VALGAYFHFREIKLDCQESTHLTVLTYLNFSFTVMTLQLIQTGDNMFFLQAFLVISGVFIFGLSLTSPR
jgi:hypothetical protein